jgi:uncharacterized protein YqeY
MNTEAVIRQDLVTARKGKDKATATVLRQVLGEITVLEKSPSYTSHTEEDVLAILRKLVKQHKESIEMYSANSAPALANLEEFELNILEKYLPAKVTGYELKLIVTNAIAYVQGRDGEVSKKDMGKIMKLCKEACTGEIDGKELSTLVREAL